MDQEGPNLWERVTSFDALQAAWHRVRSNEGSAGGDGVNLREFGNDLYANLTQLRAEILGGTYKTRPFRKVSIPKKKPGYRILTIPSIRDRVLHTSISIALTPIFEAIFEDSSFAYRPGRGVVHTVERIEQWRKRGYDVVIEADIIGYFDNIDQTILYEKVEKILSPLPGSAPVLALIQQCLDEQAKALGTPNQGVVQGSPLSPLLANLYLDALDEEIEDQGVKIVRYADDFVILCKSQKKAEKVLKHVVKVLDDHNLALHEDGTRIVNFDQGFDFVGYLFVKSLAVKEKTDPSRKSRKKAIKSEVTDDGIIELEEAGSSFDPGRRVLYVLDVNHKLVTRNRSFSVVREDGAELIAIPHKRIGRIEIGERIDISRAALDLASTHRIPLALIDHFGQTKGQLIGNDKRRAKLQLLQAKAIFDQEFRTEIAKYLVSARIRNQRIQLMRLNRDKQDSDIKSELDAMMRLLKKLPEQTSINEIRGIEGAATSTYWPTLGNLFDDDNLKFVKRTRPAKDIANTAINYLTGILERDIRGAIQSVGLHAGFAFLHDANNRNDALVFDLMEPFRAPLTEGLVTYMFNARRLSEDMFLTKNEEEIEINKEGKNALIHNYEIAIAKRVLRPDSKGKLTWRAMMRQQAQSLAHAIKEGNVRLFFPYTMQD